MTDAHRDSNGSNRYVTGSLIKHRTADRGNRPLNCDLFVDARERISAYD
jgi:hypothetical protein